MKKFITRLTTIFMTVFTMATISALPVTAFAAEDEITPVAISEEAPAYEETNDDAIVIQPMNNTTDEGFYIQQLGNTAGGSASGASASGSNDADTAYTNVMTFIFTWIRRLGAAVAVFGGIMLALSLKKDDADQKESGIKTMIAGFVVWAICGAIGLFDLFT